NFLCRGELSGSTRRQLDLNLAGNGRCHIALQSQNVAGSAVVVFRPDMGFVGDLNQLRRDSNPPATAPNGSFEHIVDSKLAANLGDSLARTFEHHARGPGDNAELLRIEAAQLGDHLFGQSITEVIEPAT